MANEFIVRKGIVSLGDIQVSGSISATGTVTISGSIASSSYASNSERLDNLDSTAFVFTSSYNPASSSFSTRVTNIEGNYATTGSNIFTGAQTVCANITSTGTIIAQTLNVQQVTSSIVYSSGSNIFGCLPSNVQQMTGSLRVTGSGNHWIVGGSVGINTTSPDPFGRGDALNVGISATGASDNMALSLNAGASGGRGSQLYMGQGGCRHFTLSSNSSETTIGTVTNTPFRINTCDTTRLYVSSSTGNVGIGATDPVKTLDVRGTLAISNNASSYWYMDRDDSDGRFKILTDSNCEAFTITTTRNVGIGTNAPTSISTYTTLEIRGATGGGIKIGKTACSQFNIQHDGTDAYFNNTANGALYVYTSDAERMRITAAGIACFACQVCIGGNLVVNGGNIDVNCDTTAATDARINFYTKNAVNGDRVSIYGYNLAATTANCEITYVGLGYCSTNNQGYINFQTKSGGAWCNTMSLRNGNVGIGTTAPPAKLVVSGTGDLSYIYNSGASTTDANFYIYSSTRDILMVRNSGNVGIGTASPEALLHLNKSTVGGEGAFIFLDNPASSTLGNKAGIRFATNAGATFSGYGSFVEAVNTNASNGAEALTFGTWDGGARDERMRITSGGCVGIGTPSPGAQLDVCQLGGDKTRACDALYLRAGGNADSFCHNQILFGYNGSTCYAHAIKTRHQSNYACDNAIDFFTWKYGDAPGTKAGQYVMSITGNGRVGIGTCAPSYPLQVNAPSNNIAAYFRAGGNSGYASVAFSGETGSAIGVLATTTGCIFFGRANGIIGNQFGAEGDIMINCANGNIRMNQSLSIGGALSKGSGSFRICHPLSFKKCTHQLVHSFIEGPQADLIYRGKINLVNGIACVNIDCASRMTEGTFEALNRCSQVFTTNESSWDAIRGKLYKNILVIESQNTESNDEISWMVIGERQDEHMLETEWTDEEGRVITEPEIMP
jgi:hypothetical protein